MDNIELQRIQKAIKFDALSMAACLGIDYEQYRRFHYGHTSIPSQIARAALELEQVQVRFMETRYKPGGDFDKELDRLHPFGIISEVC